MPFDDLARRKLDMPRASEPAEDLFDALLQVRTFSRVQDLVGHDARGQRALLLRDAARLSTRAAAPRSSLPGSGKVAPAGRVPDMFAGAEPPSLGLLGRDGSPSRGRPVRSQAARARRALPSVPWWGPVQPRPELDRTPPYRQVGTPGSRRRLMRLTHTPGSWSGG
jgi:hypothetical protein